MVQMSGLALVSSLISYLFDFGKFMIRTGPVNTPRKIFGAIVASRSSFCFRSKF